MSAEVTLCVLDLDGGAMLERCIASLRGQTIPVRILIVDNGSAIPVTERIPDVEVIRFEHNTGFAAGANAAIRATGTPLVGIVNNDVVLDPEWTTRLFSCFEDPRVAAAQSIVMRMDGLVDSAGIEIVRGRFVQSGHGRPLEEVAGNASPWGVAGTAMLLRRSALGEVPFSEPLFAWYEDVELSARLRSAGWTFSLVISPLAHHEGSSTAAKLPSRGEPLRVRNRYLVARSRGVGSPAMLLLEDARRMLGALVRLRFGLAGAILRGVASGLVARKLPPLRVRSAPE